MKHMNLKIFFITLIGVICILFAVPITRSYIIFAATYTFSNPNAPSCTSIPEPPHLGDVDLPTEEELANPQTSLEASVSEVVRRDTKNFVQARIGSPRYIGPSDEISEGVWLDVWLKSPKNLLVEEQREYWDPTLSRISEQIFREQPEVSGLEFRMYYNNNLTYWVQTVKNFTKAEGYDWYQIRYSECKRMPG